jgi:hypothetical protein
MIKDIKALLTCATALASLSSVAVVAAAATTSGCTEDAAGCPAACPAGCPAVGGDAQTPPQGSDATISAWITAGSYKGAGWKCEAAVHDARSPSPHGKNKICSNTKLAATVAPAKYAFGAASVKELYMADGTTLLGIATSLKLYDGDSDGAKWYFYEKLGSSVVFNGVGKKDSTDLCSGCHKAAGTDAGHSGRDFVYTQVP